METRRLKNISILILLILNIFLLLLLGYQELQARRSQIDAEEQLRDLFAAEQLTLSHEVDLSQPPLSPLTLSRQSEEESAIAAFLLGESVEAVSQGGGIYSYTAHAGSIQFRSGGGFDGTELCLPVENAASFARDFFQQFDYLMESGSISRGSGSITAVQHTQGIPIDTCTITLTFHDHTLIAVSGVHISLDDAYVSSDAPLSCVSALVRFLDHWRTAGVVCRKVTNVHCLYRLESASATLRLIPTWQIDTDTYTYFVDASSGFVFRR